MESQVALQSGYSISDLLLPIEQQREKGLTVNSLGQVVSTYPMASPILSAEKGLVTNALAQAVVAQRNLVLPAEKGQIVNRPGQVAVAQPSVNLIPATENTLIVNNLGQFLHMQPTGNLVPSSTGKRILVNHHGQAVHVQPQVNPDSPEAVLQGTSSSDQTNKVPSGSTSLDQPLAFPRPTKIIKITKVSLLPPGMISASQSCQKEHSPPSAKRQRIGDGYAEGDSSAPELDMVVKEEPPCDDPDAASSETNQETVEFVAADVKVEEDENGQEFVYVKEGVSNGSL